MLASQQAPTSATRQSGNVCSAQHVTPSNALYWSPPDWAVIKHIPKSARPTCAGHLTSLIHTVVDPPEVTANWPAIGVGLSYSRIETQLTETHILESCIKKRAIASFPPSTVTHSRNHSRLLSLSRALQRGPGRPSCISETRRGQRSDFLSVKTALLCLQLRSGQTASRKQAKNTPRCQGRMFQPIALETLGPINESAKRWGTGHFPGYNPPGHFPWTLSLP